MQITIRETGLVQVLSAVRALGEAGAAVAGPIATWGSPVVYAGPVEYRWRTGSGGARMFQRGVAQTLPAVPGIIGPAIPRGAAAVGQAKRAVRDLGIANIKALTPVLTGRLRASVTDLSRPGSITSSTPIGRVASRVSTRMTRPR